MTRIEPRVEAVVGANAARECLTHYSLKPGTMKGQFECTGALKTHLQLNAAIKVETHAGRSILAGVPKLRSHL